MDLRGFLARNTLLGTPPVEGARGPGTDLPPLFDPKYPKPTPNYQGILTLDASKLIQPQPVILTESAISFKRIKVTRRTVRIFCPGQLRIFNYIQDPPFFDETITLSRKLHASSSLGYLDLPAGDWMVNTPIVTAEGTKIECVLQDAALGNTFDAASAVGNAAPSNPDQAVIWTSFAQIAVNAADTAVVGASITRKGLSLWNRGATVIAVTDENPATAVSRGVLILPAGAGVLLTGKDCPTQALRAFGSAAGGLLSGATGI